MNDIDIPTSQLDAERILPPARIRLRRTHDHNVSMCAGTVGDGDQTPVAARRLPPARMRRRLDPQTSSGAADALQPVAARDVVAADDQPIGDVGDSRVIAEPPAEGRSPQALLDLLRTATLDPASISWREFVDLRRWCRSHVVSAQAKIRALVVAGHMRRAPREAWQQRAKLAFRLNALFDGLGRWRREQHDREGDRAAQHRDAMVAVFNALPIVARFDGQATAIVKYVQKPGGGNRPITSFSWLNYARQRLLVSTVQPFADFHCAQFQRQPEPEHRGLAAVRKALLKALEDADDTHVFLHMDVRDFYGSIRHSWVEGHLGVERGIVQRHIHTGGMRFIPLNAIADVRQADEALRESDRRGGRGLPQGSALSPLVAEMVMADILRSAAVFNEVQLFVWSDNIGVLVPRSGVGALQESIREAFLSHGAGPFQLTSTVHSVAREFKFLDTWYRVEHGEALAYVPDAVAMAWEASISGRLLTAGLDKLDQIEMHIRSKLAAWSWWEGSEDIKDHLSGALARARRSLGG